MKDDILRAWMDTFLFVKGAKHLPIQHNAVKVALFEVILPRAMQNQQQYLDFSMEQLPCNESVLNSVCQAAGSCQWIQEILTMCLQGYKLMSFLTYDTCLM